LNLLSNQANVAGLAAGPWLERRFQNHWFHLAKLEYQPRGTSLGMTEDSRTTDLQLRLVVVLLIVP